MPLKNHNLAIVAVAFIIFGVVSYGYWSLAYAPMSTAIRSTQEEKSKLKAQLDKAIERASQLNKVQAEMASLQVDVAGLEKQLPKTRELPSLLRVLTHRAEANGVVLTALRPSRLVAKGLYDEIPYEVTATSSLHSMGHFLTSMGKGDRLFAARNLTLNGIAAKADPSKTVNASFTLIAFKYHE
jgi:type IV pilus assembly protein PilO